MKRETNIDLIKIIACLGVVGQHTLTPVYNKFACMLYYQCSCAIPLFFMITGYFVLNRKDTDKHYCNTKILNILRVTILWTLIYYLLNILTNISTNGLSCFSENISNNSGITGVTSGGLTGRLVWIYNSIQSLIQKNRLGHLWYMIALLIMYLIIPYISKLSTKGKLIILGTTFLISITIHSISVIFKISLESYIPQVFRLWLWIFYITLGWFIGYIRKILINRSEIHYKSFRDWESLLDLLLIHIQDKINTLIKRLDNEILNKTTHTIIFIILTLSNTTYKIYYMYAIKVHNKPVMNTEHYYGSLLEILWIISLFTLILRIRLNENQQRRIEQISTLTFGIYMIHPVIGAMVNPTPETNILGYTILLVIVIIPSLLCAVLINKLPTKLRNSLVKI